MSLLVDNLRLGTTYTLSVVGYNEAGEGKIPRLISLTTKSIKPDPVNLGTFDFDTSRRVVTWNSPPFPGEDLKYRVSLEDALKGGVVSRSTTSELGAPQGTKIIEYACERIKITWFEPDVRIRNGPITGYKFKNKVGKYFLESYL
uniref:Uncharacterized protein n=1 Tax=Magallana gigas TaxID=29159 RepID=K1Q0U3_MAGGI